MTCLFSYEIFMARLSGAIDKKRYDIKALSGGGGGRRDGIIDVGVVNNPYATGLKTVYGDKHVHGGPIPVGPYGMERPRRHPQLGRSVKLIGLQPELLLGRDGFYIHGRGPHGSDGCIVPMSDFASLMDGLEEEAKKMDKMAKKQKKNAERIIGTLFVFDSMNSGFA